MSLYPLEILGYFSQLLRRFALAELSNKKFLSVSVVFFVIATCLSVFLCMASGQNVGKNVPATFCNGNVVVLSQYMPQPTWSPAIGATIIPVSKTYLPLVFSESAVQRLFSRPLAMSASACVSRMVVKILPMPNTAFLGIVFLPNSSSVVSALFAVIILAIWIFECIAELGNWFDLPTAVTTFLARQNLRSISVFLNILSRRCVRSRSAAFLAAPCFPIGRIFIIVEQIKRFYLFTRDAAFNNAVTFRPTVSIAAPMRTELLRTIFCGKFNAALKTYTRQCHSSLTNAVSQEDSSRNGVSAILRSVHEAEFRLLSPIVSQIRRLA